MSENNEETEEPEGTPEGTEEPQEETTAQRLVRELREAEGTRINLQASQDVVNPMELAKFMGVRPQHVYADIRSGKLPAVKLNNTQKLYIALPTAVNYAAAYLDRKALRLLERERLEQLIQAS